eukprot:4150421-Pleurochrysis_carterae.AAC.2
MLKSDEEKRNARKSYKRQTNDVCEAKAGKPYGLKDEVTRGEHAATTGLQLLWRKTCTPRVQAQNRSFLARTSICAEAVQPVSARGRGALEAAGERVTASAVRTLREASPTALRRRGAQLTQECETRIESGQKLSRERDSWDQQEASMDGPPPTDCAAFLQPSPPRRLSRRKPLTSCGYSQGTGSV